MKDIQSIMAAARTKRKLEDIFNCCLCCEPYDTSRNIPKVLPCVHTFCALCLDKIIQVAGDNGQNPGCPKCRLEFSTRSEGARKLPTNFVIQDMIELNLHHEVPPKRSRQRKLPTCKTHPNKELILVCMKCEVGLCVNCVKTLSESEHSNHKLEDIETYLSAYKEVLAELTKRSSQLPERYERAKIDADKNLSDTKRERENDIDKQAELALGEVKRWQESQKHAEYKPFYAGGSWYTKVKSFLFNTNTDVNSEDIEGAVSDVDMLCNREQRELPSVDRAKSVMRNLLAVEVKCLVQRQKQYQKPPIDQIIVTTKREQKKEIERALEQHECSCKKRSK